jgi:acetyltransferase-like isoleucine patch superfamily enzyme
MKKTIKFVISIPNKIYNFFVLKYRHVKWGEHLEINGRIFCVSNSKDGIVLGNHVSINSSHSSNPIGGDSKTTLFAKGDGKIRIGDNCGISNSTIFAVDSVTIGDNVFLGGGTKIYDNDFHWLDLERRMKEDGGVSKPVVIEDGVFVGAQTIVLKGVTIGKEAVVGAGSVVTKSIPAGEIWGGNPAKFIRCISKE